MKLQRKTQLGAAALVAAAVIAMAVLSSASGSTAARTVSTGHALGKTVLANRAGRTLYSLSAETHGRFICTGHCLSNWPPLLIRRGHRPTGAHSLGTIRRPEGRTQVTYRGKPLYTFVGDHKRGQARGEGLRDVGVWHAAAVRSSTNQAPAAAPAPTTTTPGYGY